jgi:hypothetical protein
LLRKERISHRGHREHRGKRAFEHALLEVKKEDGRQRTEGGEERNLSFETALSKRRVKYASTRVCGEAGNG